jgi:hypothetical protein
MNAKQLNDLAQNVFGKRTSLLSLWQEIAENFYPERADFTYKRSLGTDFAAGAMTSYPFLCRRDLGDQIGTMLRPTAKEWFHMLPKDPGRDNNESKRWLEYAANVMRRAMYDRASQFTIASKQADHDFACFGQSATSVRLSRNADHLLYRCWHLRDVAWTENEDGAIGFVARRWKPTAQTMYRIWGDKVNRSVKDALEKDPFKEVECLHMVVEADMYDENGRHGWWSIYWDTENSELLEAVNVPMNEYNIARWQTVSGSQYAFSPATVVALPEARLLQNMTYTLLEAGEKVTNPPMIAVQDVVRSDAAIFAGGMTWVDRDYDERMGAALRTMPIDGKGLPFGAEQARDSRGMLMQCFYLNKLSLPQRGPEMTAYEIGQRVQEYIRGALPIFEPMEAERNGAECELTFEVLRRHGAFGSPEDMPKVLHGADVEFGFESPLHDAIDAVKGNKFSEMKALIAEAAALDKNAINMPDTVTALRDALDGIGVPAKWIRGEREITALNEKADQQQTLEQTLGAMDVGADIAQKAAGAMKDRSQAGALVPA